MVKRKKNNIYLIIVLIIIVLLFIGFFIHNKITFKENFNYDKDIIQDDILRRDNFIKELSGKKYHISYVYKKYNSDEFYNGKNINIEEEKKHNNYVYNIIYLEILLNNKKIKDIKIPIYYNFYNLTNDDLLKKISISPSDSINILKGSNSEYFVFTIEHSNVFSAGGINPIIVNKDGNVIYTLEFKDGTAVLINDERSIMYNKGEYYLTDEILYYLIPNCERSDGSHFDQYALKVDNDRVVIENQGTYEGTAIGGAFCQD